MIRLTVCRSSKPRRSKVPRTAAMVGASRTHARAPAGASGSGPMSAGGSRLPHGLCLPSPNGQPVGPCLATACSSVKSRRPYAKGMCGPPDCSIAANAATMARSARVTHGWRSWSRESHARALPSPAFSGSAISASRQMVPPSLPPVFVRRSYVPLACHANRTSSGVYKPSSCDGSRRKRAASARTRAKESGVGTRAHSSCFSRPDTGAIPWSASSDLSSRTLSPPIARPA